MKWDNPTADQFYMMQVAAEVRKVPQAFSSSPKEVDINEFKLPFDRGGKKQEVEKTPESADQAAAIAMSKWFALAGYKRE